MLAVTTGVPCLGTILHRVPVFCSITKPLLSACVAHTDSLSDAEAQSVPPSSSALCLTSHVPCLLLLPCRFYAPQVFLATGASTSNALLSSVIIGLVNVAAIIVAILAVDRLGRRFLLLQGGAQMVVTQVGPVLITC